MNRPSDPADTKRIDGNDTTRTDDNVTLRLVKLAEQLDRALASQQRQRKEE